MSEAKVRIRVAHNAMHLPVVALRGLVVFPNNVVHFEVGRQKSIAAIEAAMHANSNIFLIAQRIWRQRSPRPRICMPMASFRKLSRCCVYPKIWSRYW